MFRAGAGDEAAAVGGRGAAVVAATRWCWGGGGVGEGCGAAAGRGRGGGGGGVAAHRCCFCSVVEVRILFLTRRKTTGEEGAALKHDELALFLGLTERAWGLSARAH